MKILAISHLFPRITEQRNGIFAARQLKAMAKLGGEISVIVPRVRCFSVLSVFKRWKKYNHKSPLCSFEGLTTFSIPYLRLPGNWYNRWAGLMVFKAIREQAVRLHKEHDFDIIYATDFFPDADAAVRLKKKLNIPVAYLGIGVDINYTAHSTRSIYKHFKKTIKKIDGTLACGRSVADGIEKEIGNKPLCVYGVVNLNEFKPTKDKISFRKILNLPLNKTVILFAGYLDERKGIFELVEAFDNLQKKRPDTALVMCGWGSKEVEFKEQIVQRKLQNKIIMAGNVDPANMRQWMMASDMLVLPSHTEGMPNVVMEAMACGLPVIATSVGGLPDALNGCNGAILIEPKNATVLEAALSTVVSNVNLRSKMAFAAREKAEQFFDIEKNARKILKHLSEIIDNS